MASLAVANLRTRIDELSLAIDRQREVLKDLENQKSTVQGDLNAILDPMTRLPVEISSDIMLRCLPTTIQPDPRAAPMLFLNICRSWSTIALSMPALWSSIQIDTKIREGFGELVDRWLARAATRLLFLSLHVAEPSPGFTALARRHVHKAQTLDLQLPSPSYLREVTQLKPFPVLTTLTIFGRGEDRDDLDYDVSECVEMLRSAPNLVACTFNDIYYFDDIPTSLMVTQSSLKRLSFHGYPFGIDSEPLYSSSAYILQHFTLPALEHLSISCDEISRDDLCAFLARSSAPLKSLCISTRDFYDVEHLLQLIPTVTDLYLWSQDFAFSVITAIGSSFLPNIRNLMIYGNPVRDEYAQVLRALSARRATGTALQSFKFLWGWDWGKEQDDELSEIIAGMRQLVKDGMDIYIGPDSRNLV
ncbi:hypothetical protein DFH07DRAFT_806824 [Mycena maculata]|uniref:F-box domain-containing protein n=1 Tax=Mycena maculata TaxID=230809 RepID=A0AAD7NNH6_9AGAR|nr:hypothetical protein DFH07DRAFT_806824 [Mycena maculata]